MIRKKVMGVISIQSYHTADDFHKKDLHLGHASMFDAERNKPPGEIKPIALQAARIGKITRRLSSIIRYKNISYPGSKKIIDIRGFSSGDVDKLG